MTNAKLTAPLIMKLPTLFRSKALKLKVAQKPVIFIGIKFVAKPSFIFMNRNQDTGRFNLIPRRYV